jgi:hypothetical protein
LVHCQMFLLMKIIKYLLIFVDIVNYVEMLDLRENIIIW